VAIGRISGEMLEQNLNLTGNLTFNDDTLTIATDGKIGIKNTSPGVELDVTGTARANTLKVLGDLSMEWTISMDAQDNLNFAYNGNTYITYDINGNITGTVSTELELLTDVDFTTNTPTTTSGLVLTSDGDSSYSFQQPVVTTQIADLTDVDFVTNTPTTTSGLVLTSDGDSTYSFQPAAAESTYQENKIIATSDGQTVFTFSAAFEGYNSTTPANSHLEIYWNGSRLIYGPNNDYTITANNQIVLTSGTGIITGDIIFAISISNMTLSRLYGP